jgi:glycosyl transferase family 87
VSGLRAALLSLIILAVAAPAAEAATVSGYSLPLPVTSTAPPPGFRLSPAQAVAAADRSPTVQKQRSRGPVRAKVSQLLGQKTWQVDYFRATNGKKPVARAKVDGVTGRLVGPVWTGPYIEWPIARGTKSAFRDQLNIAVILLSVLFVLPFLDPRRPFRMLHLDVLAIASFTIPLVLFNNGHLYASVPLQYPPLLYVLGRLLWVGTRGRAVTDESPMPLIGERLLLAGVVALVIARIVFNAVAGPTGDVAYAGIFGADSIHHGWNLYTVHPTHLDTYGPINYLLYLPFEIAFPLGPGWQAGPMTAAHAAAVTFDLAVVVLLMALGRKLGPGRSGRRLGLILAYAWVACPATIFPLAVSANDSLNAVFVLLALLALGSPIASGALLGLGGATKFAPLGLVPLFAGGLRRSVRDAAVCIAAAAAVFVLAFLPYVHQSGLGTVWDSTLGFQLSRASPFTLWGLHPSLDWVQPIVKAVAVTITVGVMFFPRERTLLRVAALAAAVILVLQMAGNYWAHTYVAWFAAPAFVALIGRYAGTTDRVRARPDAERAPIAGVPVTSGS